MPLQKFEHSDDQVELTTPLPQYEGRIPKYLIDEVIAEAVKTQRKSREIVSMIAGQLERQHIVEIPPGFEEILAQQSYSAQRVSGITFSLDTLAHRVDGESWQRYIDTEAPSQAIE